MGLLDREKMDLSTNLGKAKLCALLQYTFSLALIVYFLISIGIRSSALEKEEPEWDWKEAKIKYHYACILQLIANALVLINSTIGVFAVTGIFIY